MTIDPPRRKPPLSYLVPGYKIAARYEIVEAIGRGGMGLVVKAKDLTLDGEIVAVKILFPRFATNATTLARFRREVILTRRLSHSNIVRIFDLNVSQDAETKETLHYITMEYVEGVNLESKLKAQKLTFEQVVSIVSQAAAALGYAHKQEIIHRDIKPANILLAKSGEIKITDFGVARTIDSSENLTRTNEAIGSPNYMSPEQITAEKVDHRADLYSLGIVAYELCASELPFKAAEWMQLVHQHMSEAIPDLRAINPEVPEWFQNFVETACAKDRNNRFHSGEEIAAYIEKYSSSRNGQKLKVGVGFMQQRWIAPSAVFLLLALIVAGGYAIFSHLLNTITP